MSDVVFVLSPAATLAAGCEPSGDHLRRGSETRTSPRRRCSGWRAGPATPRHLVQEHVTGRPLGFVSPPGVNVLEFTARWENSSHTLNATAPG